MSKFVIAIALLFTSTLGRAECDIEDQPMSVPGGSTLKTASRSNVMSYSAQIRTPAQLKAHLALQGANSPLAALAPAARQEFVEQLTFNENGLTGYRYSLLEQNLTPSQIYSILSLFGAQKHIGMFKNAKIATSADAKLLSGGMSTNAVDECHPAAPPGGGGGTGGGSGGGSGGNGGFDDGIPHGNDYKDYACKAKATCSYSARDICMSTC